MSLTHDIALIHSPGWSHHVAREVMHTFPDRSFLFSAEPETLRTSLPRFTKWIDKFLCWRHEQHPKIYEDQLLSEGISCIGRDHPEYPPLLHHIHEPPLILFVQGTLKALNDPCAVIGSRKGTSYGSTQAFRFGKELAEKHKTVVSGLAYGIDEYALRGACSAGGNTVAVLAGGHHALSTREKTLHDLIIKHGGAVISEKIPHTPPNDYLFPIRNRIIAGIAQRVLVIEGAIKSGSLITARSALKENRDVFALPGPITSPTSAGCNLLIQEGAGLCTSIYDLLNLEQPSIPQAINTEPHSYSPQAQPRGTIFSALEKKLWEYLQQPRTSDSLIEYAKEQGSIVAGILNIWEIEGYLAIKNGHYHLTHYEHSSHC